MGGAGAGGEALGRFGDAIVMAHPDHTIRHAVKQRGFLGERHLRLAELRGLHGPDSAAQHLGHDLGAIAYAQDRHPQAEKLRPAEGASSAYTLPGPPVNIIPMYPESSRGSVQ